MLDLEYNKPIIDTYRDAFDLICGELLGSGHSRKVFTCALNPDWVVKVESGEFRRFNNVDEYRIWSDLQYAPEYAKWLNPSRRLSSDGRILIADACDPVPRHMLPKTVPDFLTDLKPENFGIHRKTKKVVCLDYSTIIVKPSLKQKKANWTDPYYD